MSSETSKPETVTISINEAEDIIEFLVWAEKGMSEHAAPEHLFDELNDLKKRLDLLVYGQGDAR